MWILPKQLHTLASVQVTEGLISDLQEQSQICEQSLLVRSKPTLARIWSRKWSKENWTQLLSGRILKPFLGVALGDEWASSLGVSRANLSAKPERELETKTLAISSLPSCTELPSADPGSSSSKTLKVSCQLNYLETDGATQPEHPFCSMSLENWNEWVTQRRQECSARKKLAHRTVEIESSSSAWTTLNQRDWKDSFNQTNERADGRMKIDQLPRQVFHEAGGLQDRDKSNSTGNRLESWPTPTQGMGKQDVNDNGEYAQRVLESGFQVMLPAAVKIESWATPRAGCPGSRKPGTGGAVLAEQVKINWQTPRSCEWKGNGPNSKQQGLCNQVKPSWATPQNRDWKNPDPVNDRWTDPSRTKGLPEQLVHLEKWPTPNMPSGGPLKDGSAIVGMNGGPGHREVIKKHFGAGAKLNPDWVCTLMGIPVGWVSVNGEGKNRIDELRLLGNGVVPQTAELAFRTLIKELSK